MRVWIERYLLREIFPYFVLTFLLLSGLVLASQMAEFSELFMKRNVPPTLVRMLMWALVPRILILTLPLALLVAIMMGLGRLHGDQELTALLSSGIGRHRLFFALLVLALPVSAAMFSLTAFEMPRALRHLREVRAELILQGIRLQMKPRVFDDRFAGTVLYIGELDRHAETWHHIFLALEGPWPDSTPSDQRDLVLITAERGRLDLGRRPENSSLILHNGMIHRKRRAPGATSYDVQAFRSTIIRFDASSRDALRLRAEREMGSLSPRNRIQEMTLSELWSTRRDPTLARRAQTELHKRLALSLSPVILAAVGVALGTTRRRGGRGYGFALSILLAALYYLLLLAGENAARAGRLPPSLALWGGNILLAGYSALKLSERFSLTRILEAGAARFAHDREISPPLRVRLLTAWDQLLWRALSLAHKLGERLVRVLSPRVRPSSDPARRMRSFSLWSPSISDRYVGSQFLVLFLTTLVGLWTLFVLFTLFELSSDIFTNNIAAHFVAEYLVSLSPSLLSSLAPPSALMAAVVTMSLLSRSGELTALRSAGVSIYRASLPILIAAALLSLAVALWQEQIMPQANAQQQRLRFYIKKGRFPKEAEIAPPSASFTWSVCWTEAPQTSPGSRARMPHRIVHFAALDRTRGLVLSPLILEFEPEDFSIRRRLEADFARWEEGAQAWRLVRVTLWEFRGAQMLAERRLDHLMLPVEGGRELFAPRLDKPEEMTSRELTTQARALLARGLDPMDLLIVRERRRANAAAVFVMALFGIPFGLTFGHKGARQAIGVGIVIGLLHWFALGFFEQLARYEYLSPQSAAWSPNGFLTAIGLYALFRSRT